MADFFEIEYLKKDHESGKIYTRYMYLSIDHLMYWEYIKDDYIYGEVFRYRLSDHNDIYVPKKFHVKFKEALIESGHKIKYFL